MDDVDLRDRIMAHLGAAARVCGMTVILHDYLARVWLPVAYVEHVSAPCVARKELDGNRACVASCGSGGATDEWIGAWPAGRVHACSAGYVKIAIPLLEQGALLGIVHAGPLVSPEGRGCLLETVDAGGRARLEDVRLVLVAVAREIARLIEPWRSVRIQEDRAGTILAYLNEHRFGDADVEGVAERLALSPSRVRHVVVELFGKPLSALSMEIRLQRGAGLLALTDRPISGIAMSLGFSDQSHFGKCFRRQYGTSPLRFRKERQIKHLPS